MKNYTFILLISTFFLYSCALSPSVEQKPVPDSYLPRYLADFSSKESQHGTCPISLQGIYKNEEIFAVDCGSLLDGPLYYVQADGEILANCGGYCRISCSPLCEIFRNLK